MARTFKQFMEKGAVAFASPRTAALVVAAALAVGATFTHVQTAPSDATEIEALARAAVGGVPSPRMQEALGRAANAGFGPASIEFMHKLDPAFVDVLAATRAASAMPFELIPYANKGLAVSPIVRSGGRLDYRDMTSPSRIVHSIEETGREMGVEIDCGQTQGRVSCAFGHLDRQDMRPY